MTDRIKMLREKQREKYSISIERFKLILDSYAETVGEPEVQRRAKAMCEILDKLPIYIADGDLLMGNAASRPRSLELDPNVGMWDKSEVDALRADGYSFSEEDEKELYRYNETLKPYGLFDGICEAVRGNERLTNFLKAGICLPPWRTLDRGLQIGGGYVWGGLGLGPAQCLVCFDYEAALHRGLNDMIRECTEEIDKIRFFGKDDYDRCIFLKSMRLCLEGMIRHAQRYSVLAEELAAKEPDKKRREELLTIAETCRRVPAEPPRSFREALQMYWFLFLIVACPNITSGMGRVDQYLYPWYKADIEAGRITDEEVVELFELLRIKDMDVGSMGGVSRRKCEDGEAKWHNMVIGGVKKDGSDATNELSYLILEALLRCPTPHHTITVRVASSTPEALILKGLECQRRGLSMPAFIGDEAYIKYFTYYGVPVEEARDYVLTGCLDANLPGRSRSMTASMTVMPMILDLFFNRGVDKATGLQVGPDAGDLERFETYEAFEAEFKAHFKYYNMLAAERANLTIASMQTYFPEPLRSAFFVDAFKSGEDFQKRELLFENGGCLCPIGLVNVGNSLYAIKKLVFEEKRFTLTQLRDAMHANWAGYEEIHKACEDADKYGNDIDAVDAVVADIYDYYVQCCESFACVSGGCVKATAVSITAHQPGGLLTGATPDGRSSGAILADGSISPCMGQDHCGPLAVFRSGMKLPQYKFQGTLLNMKFHPSALKDEDDLKKLGSAIKVYFANGGKHVQFNVTSRETLIEAQKKPKENESLMVRVAGYSAYFVQLNNAMQDEIIARTTNESVS